jgi:hypothetical protein
LSHFQDQAHTFAGGLDLRFKLLFWADNADPASGSIDKPVLVLKAHNRNVRIEIKPTTKKQRDPYGNRGDPLSFLRRMYDLVDTGGTIYLRGGESARVEIEYIHSLSEAEASELRAFYKDIEHWLIYRDNLGKKLEFPINDLVSLNDMHVP